MLDGFQNSSSVRTLGKRSRDVERDFASQSPDLSLENATPTQEIYQRRILHNASPVSNPNRTPAIPIEESIKNLLRSSTPGAPTLLPFDLNQLTSIISVNQIQRAGNHQSTSYPTQLSSSYKDNTWGWFIDAESDNTNNSNFD